jgi:hypothetical protein
MQQMEEFLEIFDNLVPQTFLPLSAGGEGGMNG